MIFPGVSIPVRVFWRDQVSVDPELLVTAVGEKLMVQLGMTAVAVSERRAKYVRCLVVNVILLVAFRWYFFQDDSTSFQFTPSSLVMTL